MNQVFKALSHPDRRRMVTMLRGGPMTSGAIAAAFDCAWPTVSNHLATLKAAGLVEAEREGASIRYRLNVSAAEEAIAFLLDVASLAPAKRPIVPATATPKRSPT